MAINKPWLQLGGIGLRRDPILIISLSIDQKNVIAVLVLWYIDHNWTLAVESIKTLRKQ